ncbi:disintegrin and metalloproteinase [Trichuris trichiura]|uniref:Disintegrin and metalloproteinase n=1 Tax=Trichuris trichiura TaxID=36087 RepID=A0A077ZN02_TRITR|nr:disintegrin and metalloproteinase [Trichuris trichiura]
MVKDGTRCGSNGLCEAQVCVSLDDVLARADCSAAKESPVCSGHGVCTNLNVCVCDDGWTSRDCSRKVTNSLMEAIDERNNTLEAIPEDQTLYDAEALDYELIMVSGISIPVTVILLSFLCFLWCKYIIMVWNLISMEQSNFRHWKCVRRDASWHVPNA